MRYFFLILLIFLLIPLIWVRAKRPFRQEKTQIIEDGAVYERVIFDNPSVVAHVVKVDLRQNTAVFQVTAKDATSYEPIKTSAFLDQFEVDIAINGSFYQIDRQSGAYSPIGLVIANGVVDNNGRFNYPALCISTTNQINIHEDGNCPEGTEQAIAGNVLVVANGEALNPRTNRFPGRANAFRPEPRTAVGLSADRQTLWLVVVDGRQGNYSEGMTMVQLAEFMVELGVETAVNLDGGGSSTLAIQSWYGANILNSPVHNGIPTLQRPIPTHLGVSFKAVE